MPPVATPKNMRCCAKAVVATATAAPSRAACFQVIFIGSLLACAERRHDNAAPRAGASGLALGSLCSPPCNSFDVIVIGAGVIGSSVAWHLAELGAGRVLVLDRTQIGAGTTAQSSGILRTHYSVVENVELARRSWQIFERFAAYLGDEEASAGLVKCGYLIAAPEGAKLEAAARLAGGAAGDGHPGRAARRRRRPPSGCRSAASTTPR